MSYPLPDYIVAARHAHANSLPDVVVILYLRKLGLTQGGLDMMRSDPLNMDLLSA